MSVTHNNILNNMGLNFQFFRVHATGYLRTPKNRSYMCVIFEDLVIEYVEIGCILYNGLNFCFFYHCFKTYIYAVI